MLASLALVAVLTASPPARADAAATYASLCAACHGPAGAGDGVAAAGLPTKPTSFADPAFWSARTDDQVKKVIKEGGAAAGKSPLMAPFGAQLNDAQTAEMIAYLKTLKKK